METRSIRKVGKTTRIDGHRRSKNVGVKNGSAKLNDELVREIRRRYVMESYSAIREDFKRRGYDLGRNTILDVVYRRKWKHVV